MIIGHQKQWRFLKSMKETGRIPHALLFLGQKSIGKKKTALEFAKFVIGGAKIENHPDFILINSVDSKNEIKISQIRDIIWKLSLRPYSAPYKIAVIDYAHQMNQESQNCFLKMLEEPKGRAILILITEYPQMLFPTILSRVQKIRFSPPKKSEIENYLIKQGVSSKKAAYFSSLALGRPGLAINFLKDEAKVKNQERFISDIEKLRKIDFCSRFQYVKNLSQDNADIKEILDIWLDYFRNLLISRLKNKNSKEIQPLQAGRGLTSSGLNGYSLSKLKKIINLIQSTDYLLSTTNISFKLALEILLMEL